MSTTNHRIVRYVLGIAVLLMLLASPLACAATIVPPRSRRNPIAVFVLAHGWTSTLVVPAPDSALIRYAYGDWHYYALGRNTIPNGIRALVWPSQGALGRAVLSISPDVNAVRKAVPADASHEVLVDRDVAAQLIQELDAAYAQQQATEVTNLPYRMRFVHHEARYTYFRNSNHVVAEWLRRLGCAVHGPTFGSRWRVQGQE